MLARTIPRLPVILTIVCLAYFIIAGLALIPYPGIENDEALFAFGVFLPERAGHIRVFGQPVVLMLMDYLGGLKAWLYTPIFAALGASVWTLRIPVLLIAALVIWLFFKYLTRIGGWKAGAIGAALLAVDTTFLITATLDWGPVVLQHLLLLGGLVLVLRFRDTERDRFLAAAFLCWGLALWDKALFAWMFSGIAVCGIALYYREILRLVTRRRVLIAALAFLLGAAPLIHFNLTRDFPTFKNKRYSWDDAGQNWTLLRYTFEGYAMAGFLVAYGEEPLTMPAVSSREAAHLWISETAGHPVKGYFPLLALLALALAPLSRKRPAGKVILFLLLSAAIAWFQMLVTANAGGSAHHSILIWPHVVGFVAVSLASALDRLPSPGRWALLAAIAVTIGSNIMVMNEYLAGLIRRGPAGLWTDACYALAGSIEERNPPIVYTADWGMGDGLRVLLDNQIPVANAIEPYSRQQLDESERAQILKRLARPNALFIAYAEGKDQFPKARALLRQWALENGYRRQRLETVNDRHGRPTFEIYRFQGPRDSYHGLLHNKTPRRSAGS